ncbi:hypothetical protein [Burkholderia sp. Bp9004]|uniref:hypothetical protein n=1 Tax=Burkholderia sp. Bp9004 TaxID=2184559 RepID=UPI000F5F550D|nr:hypothetical protein [Burkholderia sp. Bp9004]
MDMAGKGGRKKTLGRRSPHGTANWSIIPRSALARKRHARPGSVTLARSTDRASRPGLRRTTGCAIPQHCRAHAKRFHPRFDVRDFLVQYCDALRMPAFCTIHASTGIPAITTKIVQGGIGPRKPDPGKKHPLSQHQLVSDFTQYRTPPHTITHNTLIYMTNIQTAGSFTQYTSGYPPHTHTPLPR